MLKEKIKIQESLQGLKEKKIEPEEDLNLECKRNQKSKLESLDENKLAELMTLKEEVIDLIESRIDVQDTNSELSEELIKAEKELNQLELELKEIETLLNNIE